MTKWIALPQLTPQNGMSTRPAALRTVHSSVCAVDCALQTESLLRLGLQQVAPPSSTQGESPYQPDKSAGWFQELPKLGAYIIDVSAPHLARKTKRLLAESHLLVPSLPLQILQPTARQRAMVDECPTEQWPEISGVPLAHRAGIHGEGVIVGVLDTGVDADHLELIDKRIDFRYVPLHQEVDSPRAVHGFDVLGHGTHVCGIIAGKTYGVASGVELMVASVIESEKNQTSLERLVIALQWMLDVISTPENSNKPAIVNMSIAFAPQSLRSRATGAVLKALQKLITTLLDQYGVLPIVSVGNLGAGNLAAPGYFLEALSVGAVDFDLEPAEFSGSGRSPLTNQLEPDLVGYGVSVCSSLERDVDGTSIYATMSGTSMAAPYVTGIAALYASVDPQLQGNALRQRLIETALPLAAPPDRVGAGLARYIPHLGQPTDLVRETT